jgi:hypothetical protein
MRRTFSLRLSLSCEGATSLLSPVLERPRFAWNLDKDGTRNCAVSFSRTFDDIDDPMESARDGGESFKKIYGALFMK